MSSRNRATGNRSQAAGRNWDGWYREAIPLADERFTQHLIEPEAKELKKR